MTDNEYAAVNELARKQLWAATKDVYARAYSNGRQMGMDAADANSYADDFYSTRFALEDESPDYSSALVLLALNPELATPPAASFPAPTLNEHLEAQLAAEYVPETAVTEIVELPQPQPRENPSFVPSSDRERLEALSGRSATVDVAVTAVRLAALAHGAYTPDMAALPLPAAPEVDGLSL